MLQARVVRSLWSHRAGGADGLQGGERLRRARVLAKHDPLVRHQVCLAVLQARKLAHLLLLHDIVQKSCRDLTQGQSRGVRACQADVTSIGLDCDYTVL